MLRLLLLNIFLFLLPTVLYTAYIYATRAGGEAATLNGLPLRILLPAGIGLIITGMLIIAWVGGDEPEGTYVPAHMENGKLVPGKVD